MWAIAAIRFATCTQNDHNGQQTDHEKDCSTHRFIFFNKNYFIFYFLENTIVFRRKTGKNIVLKPKIEQIYWGVVKIEHHLPFLTNLKYFQPHFLRNRREKATANPPI